MKKIGIVVIVGIVGTIVDLGCACFVAHASAGFTVAVHSPKPPIPNAYDALLKAYSLISDGSLLLDIYAQPHPGDTHLTPEVGGPGIPLPLFQDAIRANEPLLDQINRDLEMRYVAPPRTNDIYNHDLMHIWDIGYLLATRGDSAVAQGDLDAASNSYLDALALEAKMQQNGTVGQSLGPSTMAFTPLKKLWAIRDRLPSTVAKHTVARLLAILQSQYPIPDMLQESKWQFERDLKAFLQKPDWAIELSEEDRWHQDSPDWKVVAQARHIGKTRLMQDCANGMGELRIAYLKPYPEFENTAIRSDAILARDMTGIKAGVFNVIGERLDDEFLLTAFALHVYFLNHGGYPTKLSDLVPGILPNLPRDPFTVNAPLQYGLKGPAYVLYSVGPGGTPDSARSIKSTHGFVYPSSRGDLVAGVRWFFEGLPPSWWMQ